MHCGGHSTEHRRETLAPALAGRPRDPGTGGRRRGHSPQSETADRELEARSIEVAEQLKPRLGDETGAFVTFVSRGSPASEAGLLVGDAINRIEEYAVADLDDPILEYGSEISWPLSSRRIRCRRSIWESAANSPGSPDSATRCSSVRTSG